MVADRGLRRMDRRMKRLSIAAGVLSALIVGVGVVLWSRGQLFILEPVSHVAIDGVPLAGPRVWRGCRNTVLVELPGERKPEYAVVFAERSEVCYANSPKWLCLPRMLFHPTPLGLITQGKTEVHANMTGNRRSFAFTYYQGGRVRVDRE
ncbi:MAG: hypothetical protein FJX72_00180 [Armatimonadetes bacterium]|nr:hypothetical protein [Armatimonadota bacterium]